MDKNYGKNVFYYPAPDRTQIDNSTLELKLRDYEAYLKSRFTWEDFLILVSAWAILLTSDFNGVWFVSSQEMKGVYFAFMFFATISLLKNKIPIIKNIFNGRNNAAEFIKILKNKCKRNCE